MSTVIISRTNDLSEMPDRGTPVDQMLRRISFASHPRGRCDRAHSGLAKQVNIVRLTRLSAYCGYRYNKQGCYRFNT
ncbi:hypothetical protein ACFOGG_13610 [Brenneria rubrifaciens]|uniref:hypothetical protein n=1 Tax=Brenneria rubrifaciens TaxID=55213 RepID=UPI0026CC1E60